VIGQNNMQLGINIVINNIIMVLKMYKLWNSNYNITFNSAMRASVGNLYFDWTSIPFFSRSEAQDGSQASLMSTFFMDTRGLDMLSVYRWVYETRVSYYWMYCSVFTVVSRVNNKVVELVLKTWAAGGSNHCRRQFLTIE